MRVPSIYLGGKHAVFFIKSSKMIKFPKNIFFVKNVSIQHIPLYKIVKSGYYQFYATFQSKHMVLILCVLP